MKAKIPTESAEQIKFVNRVRHFYPGLVIFAIPNGGGRSPMEATRLKEEGVLAGVPDLMIPLPCFQGDTFTSGFFIEMKRQSGGYISKEQDDMLVWLRAAGYHAFVAYGCTPAWEKFEQFMEAGGNIAYNKLCTRG